MIDGVASFAAAAVRTATPLALAASGELLVECAGMINMGLEGAILAGAFGALVGARGVDERYPPVFRVTDQVLALDLDRLFLRVAPDLLPLAAGVIQPNDETGYLAAFQFGVEPLRQLDLVPLIDLRPAPARLD